MRERSLRARRTYATRSDGTDAFDNLRAALRGKERRFGTGQSRRLLFLRTLQERTQPEPGKGQRKQNRDQHPARVACPA